MKNIIKDKVKEYMKSGQKVELQALRSVLAAIQYEEMLKKVENLDEKDLTNILQNEIKKRRESLEFEEKANRMEQQSTLKVEIATLENFLPKQFSEEEIRNILQKLKSENASMNMGLAMKELKDKFSGQYDGKLASNLAKEIFA